MTFWKRYGLYIALYLAVIAAFASVRVWKYVDFAILSQMLGQNRTLDPEIVAVDLNAPLGHVRPPLADVLETICKPHDPAAETLTCTRSGEKLPKLVVIDVEFINNRGDPAIVARLVRDIKALRAAGVRVYGAVLPSNDPGDQNGKAEDERAVEEIYGVLSGYGHTKLDVVPFFRGGVTWYEPVIEFPNGSRLEALPLNVVKSARESALPTAVHDERIVPIGSHAAFLEAIHRAPLPADFEFTADDWVLIGDVRGERDLAASGNGPDLAGRTGFELLAFALDDEKKRTEGDTANGAARYEPHVDVFLMLILLALFSAASVVAYRLIFARLRTRRACFSLSLGGALLVTFAALYLLELVLVANHQIYAQLTLVSVGIITAGALTARWTVADVHHTRFLTGLWADAERVGDGERFDVFISYARDPENAAWVEEHVYRPLSQMRRADGTPLRVFFDRDSIKAGNDWYRRIVTAIYRSERFVAVYSKGYFERWFCRDELELAMLRAGGGKPFIVPLSRVGGAIPKRYASIQFVDVERNPNFIDEVALSVRDAGAETARVSQ